MVPVHVGGAVVPQLKQQVEREIREIQAAIKSITRQYHALIRYYNDRAGTDDFYKRAAVILVLHQKREGLEDALDTRSSSPELDEPLPEGEFRDLHTKREKLQEIREGAMKVYLAYVNEKLKEIE